MKTLTIKRCVFMLVTMSFLFRYSSAQEKSAVPVPIILGEKINNVNEEFSGLAISETRLFLLPQYGDALINGDSKEKDTVLNKQLKMYSYPVAAINFALDHKTALSDPDIFYFKYLTLLPDSVKQVFRGFEAVTVINNTVYLSIESPENRSYCFLIKGYIDTLAKEIVIDPFKILSLKRPFFIKNAGFESLAFLHKENKLITMYEFNAALNGGLGYLIDTSFETQPELINIPKLFFRITDIGSNADDAIYGVNYYWNGDYNNYLNNDIVKNPEESIGQDLTGLKDSITNNSDYLKDSTTCYARIVKLNKPTDSTWKHIISFEKICSGNNWEGLTPFRRGVLVISDANRNKHLVTSLAYVEFTE